ncbi:hypothetical protein SCLCIDRAFT_1088604 [Scleroderma citrinum Foug A]|uniref:Uncharacterized protein n=1 Tax=Scleroderma citrinum Foug A TaxID=1036808 RepID=A0A0C3DR23_9AGAM|nr:hypothetical protein SCLCIDRAFT_1088604 [Scleroderma citrinum Foug A]
MVSFRRTNQQCTTRVLPGDEMKFASSVSQLQGFFHVHSPHQSTYVLIAPRQPIPKIIHSMHQEEQRRPACQAFYLHTSFKVMDWLSRKPMRRSQAATMSRIRGGSSLITSISLSPPDLALLARRISLCPFHHHR